MVSGFYTQQDLGWEPGSSVSPLLAVLQQSILGSQWNVIFIISHQNFQTTLLLGHHQTPQRRLTRSILSSEPQGTRLQLEASTGLSI